MMAPSTLALPLLVFMILGTFLEKVNTEKHLVAEKLESSDTSGILESSPDREVNDHTETKGNTGGGSSSKEKYGGNPHRLPYNPVKSKASSSSRASSKSSGSVSHSPSQSKGSHSSSSSVNSRHSSSSKSSHDTHSPSSRSKSQSSRAKISSYKKVNRYKAPQRKAQAQRNQDESDGDRDILIQSFVHTISNH